MNDGVAGFLLHNLDIMKNLVDTIGRDEEEGDVSAFLKEIESFRNSQKGQAESTSDEAQIDESIMKVLSEYEEHRLKTNIKDGKGVYLAKAVFVTRCF